MAWNKLSGLLLGAALGLSAPAFSNDDSSADAGVGFGQTVQSSQGVMIKVPIDKDGNEHTDAAEMRVFTGNASVDGSTNFDALWSNGIEATQVAEISQDDVSSDSSTSGWFGWRNRGWRHNYYYNHRPTYYYNYNYYSYNRPYYRTYNYGYGNYYGCRYYYYPRW